MKKGTLVVINGSYHKDGLTTKCLKIVSERISKKHRLEVVYFYVDDNLTGCKSCGPEKCVVGCKFNDQTQEIFEAVTMAKRILIGTPVYLDCPTGKLLNLLSRFTSSTDKNRKFFKGKKVHLHANAWCSGTKSTIGVLMQTCEMLGFTIEGRSTTEYIQIWKDTKTRGGMDDSPLYLES